MKPNMGMVLFLALAEYDLPGQRLGPCGVLSSRIGSQFAESSYPTLLVENGEFLPCNILTNGGAMAVINGGAMLFHLTSKTIGSIKSLYR